MKQASMWKYLGFALLFMLVRCQSKEDKTECMKRQKNLALLDLTEETISKAKEEVPDCGGENGTQSNSSDCSKRGKTLAFLEIAANLVSDVKRNYTKCSTKSVSSSPSDFKPMDCSEVLENGHSKSGVYTIWPRSRLSCNESVEVYCDMETDGGGWTVIQRRGNFTKQENFARNWESYKNGFGNITRDFWIGNDNIYMLSNQGCYEARFDLEDAKKNKTFATYGRFWIENEKLNYTLYINNYSGDAGDSMAYHNNQKFGTVDRPNTPGRNCPSERGRGGWWYDSCTDSSLNGIYNQPGTKGTTGVFWRKWKDYESLLSTEIKLRPRKSTSVSSIYQQSLG